MGTILQKNVNEAGIAYTNKQVFLQGTDFDRAVCMAALCYSDSI